MAYQSIEMANEVIGKLEKELNQLKSIITKRITILEGRIKEYDPNDSRFVVYIEWVQNSAALQELKLVLKMLHEKNV